jgi:general secretion pathway protein D
MRTYRKKLLYFGILAAVLVLTPLPILADTIVSIQPPVLTPDVGSFFDILINIASVNDLYAFQFDVSFNSAVIAAISVTEGAFLQTGGATFFIPGFIDNISGLISFTANSLVGEIPGVNGSGALVDLKFQALAAGLSSLDLSNLVFLDANFGEIAVNSLNGKVSVVPEPVSMLLYGTGVVVFGGYVRRKFKQN